MLSLKVVVSTVCVLAATCLHLEAKGSSKEAFKFVESSYGKALSEYHTVNKKVLHIRAIGGRGKITYSINETGSPFRIDNRGRIFLEKPLSSDVNKFCELTVIAEDKDHKTATAKVRFDIMNMNKHKPEFQNKRFICTVTENSRVVSILPPIHITDEDHGLAGKLNRIDVVESGIPFKFNIKKNGEVEAIATKDLDAEKESGFSFDIKAWDSGDPPKSSDVAQMECQVVDANEFAPEFDSNAYTAEVERGKTYKNILQIEATDKDIGKEYGTVCKYIIRTIDVPFKISNDGVLYLDTPLGPESPEYCSFEVAAIDCGGKMSVNNVNVGINIKNSCKPGFNFDHVLDQIYIPQCEGLASVAPDIQLNTCSKQTGVSKFMAKIKMSSSAGKGCDRHRYKASDMYQLCGADKVTDLLPRYGTGREWTKKLKMVNGAEKDDATFFFDGEDDHADIPSEVFPDDLGDEFTISFWMATKADKKKHSHREQVILSSADHTKHNRIHFAVKLKPHQDHNELHVTHRLEPWQADINRFTKAEYHYRPTVNITDTKWHHVTISVSNSSVSLHIDGEYVKAYRTNPNFRLHDSDIKPHVVVGALWKGKEKVYEKCFRGYLSGMTVRPSKQTSTQTIQCLMGCREHINIETDLPKGFTSTMPGFNTMVIKGTGRPADFEKILKNIQYQNDLFTPTPGDRKFQITATQNGIPLPEVGVDVKIEKNTKPVITLEGCGEVQADIERIRSIGVPVCRTLKIKYKGCDLGNHDSPVYNEMFLDEAVVQVTPSFEKSESLKFPMGRNGGTILDDYDLDASPSKDGIIIRGLANYQAYEQILRDMTYVNLNPKTKLRHTFTIYVSDQNGRFMSDKEVLDISAPRKQIAHKLRPFELEAMDETLKRELPGAQKMTVNEASAAKGTMSSGIMAVIIIASACVFLLLVALGIYRLRRSASTLEVPAKSSEKEEMYWDDTGLSGVRITVNPLQKFQELDLNEDNESEHGNSDDEDNQQAKGSLEWDESDM